MNDSRILPFCHKNGIKLQLNWRSHCNKIAFHNKNESRLHFMYKAIVGFELMKAGQTVFSEFEFRYGGQFGHKPNRMKFPVCDLFWLDELIVIEFESNLTEANRQLKSKQFREMNCFVFDIKKTSFNEIYEKIGLQKLKEKSPTLKLMEEGLD